MNFSEIVLLTRSSYYYDIKEWIEYYIKLGFDYITIYDNESPVDIEKLTKQYSNISYFKIAGYPDQLNLELTHYNQSKYNWVFFCDDDEFLWLSPKYKNVNDFITKKSEELQCDNIAIYWTKIAENPCPIERADTPETTQIKTFLFTQFIEIDSWTKCFYKTGQKIEKMQCHYASPLINTKDVNNNNITINDVHKFDYNFMNDDAIIYHYYHKSWKEFYTKMNSRYAARPTNYKDEFPKCQDIKNYFNYARLLYNIGYCKNDNKIRQQLYET